MLSGSGVRSLSCATIESAPATTPRAPEPASLAAILGGPGQQRPHRARQRAVIEAAGAVSREAVDHRERRGVGLVYMQHGRTEGADERPHGVASVGKQVA